MNSPIQQSHEKQQVQIEELKKALDRFGESGSLDLGFAQQMLAETSKSAASLAALKGLMERANRDNTKSFECLKNAIKAVHELKASVTPALLLKKH